MENIVNLLWQRDENAVSQIAEQYGGYCRKILSGFLASVQDVEEAMNDVLLQIWKSIPPARPNNFKAYLAKAARNTALHYVERAQAQKRRCIGQMLAELDECIPDRSAEHIPEQLQLKDVLNAFVRSLHGQERSFFLRRYYFGQSIGQIAAAHKCTENKVSVSLVRTRQKLRKVLEREECMI